ncbi:hypothetical protein VTN49DRAFT_7875 [Thermomyces lanuginosus]|uniref:uncharacterized protein n=1 Tax=Thermomyces lanuginosus TaxID=5541 RepID=UPI00374452E0
MSDLPTQILLSHNCFLTPGQSPTQASKMYAASATRARLATSLVARRGFSTTRAQLASPYHYGEGPRSNIPFNPLTKYFAVRYWAFMATGFFLPFGIALWQLKKTRP